MRASPIRSWEDALVMVLLAVFLMQAMTSATRKSLTMDEYTHFGAAVSYVNKGYYGINVNHPPFSKVITGLSLLPLDTSIPELPPEGVPIRQRFYGIRFCRSNAEDIERITLFGRLPHMFIALVLGVGLWLVARYFFGVAAGLAALALWATDPNFIAHARLVHTDSDAAAFVFLCCACLALLLYERPTYKHALLFSLLFGLAVLTKYSALILIGIIPVYCALRELGVRKGYMGPLYGTGTPAAAATAPMTLACTAVVVAALALILYRGQPQWYFRGLAGIVEHNRAGHSAYLLGRWSRTGWWYYFIVALGVKAPLPLLGLAAIGLVAAARRFPGRGWYAFSIFMLPGLIWFVASMLSSINIGIRHILPAYAFLFLLAAAGAYELLRWRRAAAAVLVVLLSWQGVVAIRTFPDYIAYFNEASGGPDSGIHYLADSNLDWGQEMLSLRDYVKRENIPEIVLRSLAAPAPDIYGIRTANPAGVKPSPDAPVFLAIGATEYARVMFGDPETYSAAREFLGDLDTVAVLGHSLYVYRVTEPFPADLP